MSKRGRDGVVEGHATDLLETKYIGVGIASLVHRGAWVRVGFWVEIMSAVSRMARTVGRKVGVQEDGMERVDGSSEVLE